MKVTGNEENTEKKRWVTQRLKNYLKNIYG